jgi:uncharacterized protein with von Willebrand factor type A (vWA) domain
MTEEQLKGYDIILLIDKSGSMGTEDMPNGQSRWDAAREQTETWARQAQKWDSDGISVGFYNNNFKIHENVTAQKVSDIFKEHTPGGSTDTDKPLEYVLNQYLTNRKKPILVFVITDGGANDEKRVAKVIADATQKMNADEEIGIQFLQIGGDPAATKFLQFLDDELVSKYNAKYDIVDTNTFDVAQEMPFHELCSKTLSD